MLNFRLAFLLFVVTRLVILFGYQAYVTDVILYFDQASRGWSGLKAYTDFFFPYPPLSLLLLYLPMFGDPGNFWEYRNFFNKEMFIVDIAVFLTLAYFIRYRLKFAARREFAVLTTYSLLGLFVGHLIYDRIDLGVVWFTLAVVMSSTRVLWLALFSNLGILFKFIPALPAGFLFFDREKKWQKTLLHGLALFVPALGVIWAVELISNPGILKYLFEHGARGIQVESIWATPWMLAHTFFGWTGGGVETNFGAQHLGQIPEWYVGLSKGSGLAVMGGLAWKVWRMPARRDAAFASQLVLTVLLVFLSTQRVLSPQFMIWLLPWAAIVMTDRSSSWMKRGLLGAVFALTYIGFDLGYWEFVRFNPFFVSVVALRNVVLVAVTVITVRELLSSWNKS